MAPAANDPAPKRSQAEVTAPVAVLDAEHHFDAVHAIEDLQSIIQLFGECAAPTAAGLFNAATGRFNDLDNSRLASWHAALSAMSCAPIVTPTLLSGDACP